MVEPRNKFSLMNHHFKVIVCAIILNEENKIFIARRKKGLQLEGFWEFPGGKLERGEELEAALKREISEELEIDIKITKLLHIKPHQLDADNSNLVFFYLCKLPENQKMKLNDHDEAKFCNVSELKDLKLLPANEEVLGMLEKLKIN